MREFSAELKRKNIRLGLLPTMGYLHEGHLSLMKLLDNKCDMKAASIFVNPIQFAPNEDLSSYPRDEARDLELLEKEGCELVFAPNSDEMYPEDYFTYVNVEQMTKVLCGKYRENHFQGVTTVVLRLFNVTGCSAAAFGLKDYQQAMLIKRMVKDLFLPVDLIFGQTIREIDGLAKSSRNSYLTPEERQAAVSLSRSLEWARRKSLEGEQTIESLRNGIIKILGAEDLVNIQYIEFVDPETLKEFATLTDKFVVAIAAFVGKTRLIDNLCVGKGSGSKAITSEV